MEQPASTAPSTSSMADITGLPRQFISLQQIHKGMTPAEVKDILGNEVVVGYKLVDRKSKLYSPLTVKNPFREQTITKGSKTYLVDYYLAGIRKADGKVSNDELVPMVFDGGKLIGSGWDFLNQQVKE